MRHIFRGETDERFPLEGVGAIITVRNATLIARLLRLGPSDFCAVDVFMVIEMKYFRLLRLRVLILLVKRTKNSDNLF